MHLGYHGCRPRFNQISKVLYSTLNPIRILRILHFLRGYEKVWKMLGLQKRFRKILGLYENFFCKSYFLFFMWILFFIIHKGLICFPLFKQRAVSSYNSRGKIVSVRSVSR